jgi:hypothetical protein
MTLLGTDPSRDTRAMPVMPRSPITSKSNPPRRASSTKALVGSPERTSVSIVTPEAKWRAASTLDDLGGDLRRAHGHDRERRCRGLGNIHRPVDRSPLWPNHPCRPAPSWAWRNRTQISWSFNLSAPALSSAAEICLHPAVARSGTEPVAEVRQHEQILDSERAASVRKRHEDIGLSGVGPRRGQGCLPAIIGKEEPVLPRGPSPPADARRLRASI